MPPASVGNGLGAAGHKVPVVRGSSHNPGKTAPLENPNSSSIASVTACSIKALSVRRATPSCPDDRCLRRGRPRLALGRLCRAPIARSDVGPHQRVLRAADFGNDLFELAKHLLENVPERIGAAESVRGHSNAPLGAQERLLGGEQGGQFILALHLTSPLYALLLALPEFPFLGIARQVAPPGPPQTRACGFPAPGSSTQRLTRRNSGDTDTQPQSAGRVASHRYATSLPPSLHGVLAFPRFTGTMG